MMFSEIKKFLQTEKNALQTVFFHISTIYKHLIFSTEEAND